jgi:hypothetical protein
VKTETEKKFFTTTEVKEILGLKNTDQARYWLKRAGALKKQSKKKGGHFYTTRELLMSAFPDVFQGLSR